MRPLSRFFALLLLTIWFPATQHCNLEAAGVIAQHCSDACLPGQADSGDNCGLVESGFYKAGGEIIQAPAPEWSVSDGFQYFRLLSCVEFTEPTLEPVESVGRPFDWVTTWQFVRRAAPPSRAPSRFLA